MGRFHIKENGEPGACTASVRDCPRGGDNEHYDTADDARKAYEKVQEGTPWGATAPSMRAASEEGARRGQVFLRNLDAAYQAEVEKTQAFAQESEPSPQEVKSLEAKEIALKIVEAGTKALREGRVARATGSYAASLEVARNAYREAAQVVRDGGGNEKLALDFEHKAARTENERLTALYLEVPTGNVFTRGKYNEEREELSKQINNANNLQQAAYERWVDYKGE